MKSEEVKGKSEEVKEKGLTNYMVGGKIRARKEKGN